MKTQPSEMEQCGVGTACLGCGRRLPLRLTQLDEEAALWECIHCQTPFAGVLVPEVVRMLSRRIRLAPIHFDIEQAEPLTDAVLQVVWRNASKNRRPESHNQRRSMRLSGHREVVILMLDDCYHLVGAPTNGVVANLSRHGLMLVTSTPIETPLVFIQFQNARRIVQLLGRLVWSRYLDVGCYGAGIDFIARFGRTHLV